VTQTVGANTTVSPAFKLVVSPGPVVNLAVTYATAPINDVGVGATAQVVVFHGTGFGTGVTIGSFVNGSNIADPNVTATVVSVNTTGTAITATIAVAAGDANIADGYTVTNTNGGITKDLCDLVPSYPRPRSHHHDGDPGDCSCEHDRIVHHRWYEL